MPRVLGRDFFRIRACVYTGCRSCEVRTPSRYELSRSQSSMMLFVRGFNPPCCLRLTYTAIYRQGTVKGSVRQAVFGARHDGERGRTVKKKTKKTGVAGIVTSEKEKCRETVFRDGQYLLHASAAPSEKRSYGTSRFLPSAAMMQPPPRKPSETPPRGAFLWEVEGATFAVESKTEKDSPLNS